MNKQSLTLQAPRIRRRAVELYSADSPFWPKKQKVRTKFERHSKHRARHDH